MVDRKKESGVEGVQRLETLKYRAVQIVLLLCTHSRGCALLLRVEYFLRRLCNRLTRWLICRHDHTGCLLQHRLWRHGLRCSISCLCDILGRLAWGRNGQV